MNDTVLTDKSRVPFLLLKHGPLGGTISHPQKMVDNINMGRVQHNFYMWRRLNVLQLAPWPALGLRLIRPAAWHFVYFLCIFVFMLSMFVICLISFWISWFRPWVLFWNMLPLFSSDWGSCWLDGRTFLKRFDPFVGVDSPQVDSYAHSCIRWCYAYITLYVSHKDTHIPPCPGLSTM